MDDDFNAADFANERWNQARKCEINSLSAA